MIVARKNITNVLHNKLLLINMKNYVYSIRFLHIYLPLSINSTTSKNK